MAAVAVLAVGMVWIAGPSGADTFRVKASGSEAYGWNWRPATSRLNRGDKVVWKNPTSKTHTVTAYGRGWSFNQTVSPGERVSKRFRKAGRFKYRCTTQGHSALSGGRCNGMCGKVRVR